MSSSASDTDWRRLYPFASREMRIDGWRYHYLDEGQGEPLLLVHGNPTWSFYWREVVAALRERYRVIAVDHLGCGLSDKPSPAQYDYRLARRVSDLGQLIEHLDLQRVTLVAHDWGGAIGMGAVVAQPKRFSRLVLMNTAAFRSERCPWPIRLCHVPLLGQTAVQGMNLFVRVALRTATSDPRHMQGAIRAGYMAPYDTWDHRAAVYRFVCDIPMRPTHPTYRTLSDIETGLRTLGGLPLCLIWGMRDWCFDESFLARFLEFFPAATVHRIAAAGHYVVEDAPDEVIAHLKAFLETHPLPATASGEAASA